jgi:hypothetical protein
MIKQYKRIVLPKRLDDGTSKRTCQQLAHSVSKTSNIPIVVDEEQFNKDDLVVLGGVGGHDIEARYHERLQQENIDYLNVEKGYCNWWKPKYWRVSFNENQVTKIKGEWTNFRFTQFEMKIKPWQMGDQVYIVAPSQSGLSVYGIKQSVDQWIEHTTAEIKQHTDRPIIVRKKMNKKSRGSRGFCDSLKNIYCVVSLHTMATTEALREGCPIISLVPGCLSEYSVDSIAKINNLYYPEDRQYLFNCLTNIQFTSDELISGMAWDTMSKYYNLQLSPVQ